MKLTNPIRTLTKFELSLWLGSLLLISVAFILIKNVNTLSLIASLVGATSLIFVSKGNPLGQALMLAFSLLYAIISYEFCYYGEMITYLGMTAPIAALSLLSWIRHPYEKGKPEVKVQQLSTLHIFWLVVLTIFVTYGFYFILAFFHTNQLMLSTVSIATSFSASALMFLRSPVYALFYAANDIVLILLWVLASTSDPTFIPMVVCFVTFIFNDLYAFINWKRISRRQKASRNCI